MIHGSICSFGWRSELRTREDRQEQIELVQDGLAEDGERPLVPFAGLACKVNAAITDVQEAAQVVRVSAAEDVSAIKAWGKQEARVSMLTFIALASVAPLGMSAIPLRFRLFLLFPSSSPLPSPSPVFAFALFFPFASSGPVSLFVVPFVSVIAEWLLRLGNARSQSPLAPEHPRLLAHPWSTLTSPSTSLSKA